MQFSSCAKTRYLIEQGTGQLSLLWNAKDNKEVLNDPKVDPKVKDKIKQVETYKKYFYSYWEKNPSKIYSKTTFLKGKAVTYLVISSKYYQIKPVKECFPFMGCFPYIGFFDKESAIEYQKDKQEDNYETYMRPVYAYSTLGYFTDTILSSFFYYKEVELADLVFHELFHTIFFIKDEVALNENLANYFAKAMTREYFKDENFEIRDERIKKSEILKTEFVKLVKELDAKYKELGSEKMSKADAVKTREQFMQERLRPIIEEVCSKNKISNCFPLKREWNNASLAAFMTYEKKANKLRQLQTKLNLDLKGFYRYIEREYEQYNEKDIDEKFDQYLFKKL